MIGVLCLNSERVASWAGASDSANGWSLVKVEPVTAAALASLPRPLLVLASVLGSRCSVCWKLWSCSANTLEDRVGGVDRL